MVAKAMTPFAVLTRPEGKNEFLAKRLSACGMASLALPAISICPLPFDSGQLPLAHDYDLVVFVSGNAASIYLEQLSHNGLEPVWPASTMAATVGAASAQPLYQSGFIAQANILHPLPEDQQDSEALWALLQPQIRKFERILIVRGETGREWLGQQLEASGALVQRYAVYRREPAVWSAQQCSGLQSRLQAHQFAVCILTSEQSAEAFCSNIETAGIQSLWEGARFVVIHERVARRLQSLLKATSGSVYPPLVKICSPNDDAIFQAVLSVASL